MAAILDGAQCAGNGNHLLALAPFALVSACALKIAWQRDDQESV